MIRKTGILLILLVILSCEKEVRKQDFHISINGFQLRDSLVPDNKTIPEIKREFSGGIVQFSNLSRSYIFDTEDIGIEEYIFSLPYGEYNLETEIPEASLYGQKSASFQSKPIHVEISNVTDTISLKVEPTCALIIVEDKKDQLENGAFMIEKHSYAYGYFLSYPMQKDSVSNCYYTYITPDTVPEDPSAFLWLYNEKPGKETGGLPTKDFKIGYKYLIKVIE